MLKENFNLNCEHDVQVGEKSVSVVICTKNNSHCLEALVESLLVQSNIKEIIIVSNDTDYDYGLELFNSALKGSRLKVVNFEGTFNFSKQSNLGAQISTGEYILFLNDDICGLSKGWLQTMLETAQKYPKCIIGPLLLYPNQTIQHGGMYLGFNDCAGHMYRGCKISEGEVIKKRIYNNASSAL